GWPGSTSSWPPTSRRSSTARWSAWTAACCFEAAAAVGGGRVRGRPRRAPGLRPRRRRAAPLQPPVPLLHERPDPRAASLSFSLRALQRRVAALERPVDDRSAVPPVPGRDVPPVRPAPAAAAARPIRTRRAGGGGRGRARPPGGGTARGLGRHRVRRVVAGGRDVE